MVDELIFYKVERILWLTSTIVVPFSYGNDEVTNIFAKVNETFQTL